MKNYTDRGGCFPQWGHTPVRHLKSRMILRRTLYIVVKFSIYLCIDHHFPRCVPLYLSTHPLFGKITDAL